MTESTFMPSSAPWRRLLAAGLLTLTVLGAGPAHAQNWPTHPIRLIVSFPPGNSADLVARTFSNLLSQRLGQPVVIENRGGAGGVIGMEAMTKAAPDGYTFAVSSLSPITIIPAINRKLPYDPIHGLMPVTLLGVGPMFILVRKDSPINSVEDLITQSRANPEKFTYGSLGPGTISQMARGLSSFLTRSAIEAAPTALALVKSFTALGNRSKTTHR